LEAPKRRHLVFQPIIYLGVTNPDLPAVFRPEASSQAWEEMDPMSCVEIYNPRGSEGMHKLTSETQKISVENDDYLEILNFDQLTRIPGWMRLLDCFLVF